MTLSEIKEKIDSTEGKKLPNAKALRMSGSEIIASDIHANGSIIVYKSGFALFSSFGRATVLRVDCCKDYRYPQGGSKGYCPPEMFENKDWKILLTMVGEDRIEHSREESEVAQITKYNVIGDEDTDEAESVEDTFWETIYYESLLLQIKAILTEKQYRVFELKYIEDLSNIEICSALDVGPSTVSECLGAIRKKIKNFYSTTEF